MIILSTHPSKRMDIQESPSTSKTIIFLKMVRITLAHYDNFPSPGASRIFCQITCQNPATPPTCHLSAAVLAPFNTCHCNCRLPISTPDPDYFLVMENHGWVSAGGNIPFNSRGFQVTDSNIPVNSGLPLSHLACPAMKMSSWRPPTQAVNCPLPPPPLSFGLITGLPQFLLCPAILLKNTHQYTGKTTVCCALP